MIRLEMKNYNMILIEKQPKYQLYDQGKFINITPLISKQTEIFNELVYERLETTVDLDKRKFIVML